MPEKRKRLEGAPRPGEKQEATGNAPQAMNRGKCQRSVAVDVIVNTV